MLPDRYYFEVPPNQPPALEPITPARSECVDDFEADFMESVVEVFEAAIRPRMTSVMLYGVPHRATFATIERFVKQEGLAIDRQTAGQERMAELFRAWRARNPRRGLAFLRLYLAMVYPGTHTVQQLWQRASRPYPSAANPTQAADSFLTSRVRITLSAMAGLTAADVARVRAVASRVVPARIVLEVYLELADGAESAFAIAAAVETIQHVSLVGTATDMS